MDLRQSCREYSHPNDSQHCTEVVELFDHHPYMPRSRYRRDDPESHYGHEEEEDGDNNERGSPGRIFCC